MDPIAIILAALAGGAAALSKTILSEAGKDLYSNLKARLQKKLTRSPQGQIALAEYEKDPKTWELPLKKSLLQVGAEQDKDILDISRQLLRITQIKGGKRKFNIINSTISGQVNTGDAFVEQHGNHNVYIGQAQQVVLGPQNRPAQIREVKIDLKLANGAYPTLYWMAEAESPNLFSSGVPQVARQWWEPSNFSHDHLHQILLDQINRWSADGWELVEDNLDDVWQTEQGSQETMMSRLTNTVGISAGRIWKNYLVFYGARFHVRRVT